MIDLAVPAQTATRRYGVPAMPSPVPVFTALRTALDAIDLDRADLYTDLVFTVPSTAARDRLEEFMNKIEDLDG